MDDFDKQFKFMTNVILGGWIFVVLLNVAFLVFGIFVIVKLMQYFGVL